MTGTKNPCLKRIKEFWQELLPAVDYEMWEDLFVATVCVHVSKTIRLLIRENVVGAQHELWETSHLLLRSKTAAEEPEVLYQALHILDIGYFAWSVSAYSRFAWALVGNVRCFCDIFEVAQKIWQERKDFGPHLSDALQVAYIFMRDLRHVSPWRAFRYALKSPNFMYELGGYSVIHGNKPIGQVLGASAMAKLKEILRAYVRERNGGAGRRA